MKKLSSILIAIAASGLILGGQALAKDEGGASFNSKLLPNADELRMPEDGEIRFGIKGVGGARGDFEAYTGADLLRHMTTLCVKSGGTPVYVIPKRHGGFKRMTEAGAPEALGYVAQAGNSGAWEIACEGEKRFLLSKDYNFTSGAGAVARFFANRGLDGVNYVKKGDDSLKTPGLSVAFDTEAEASVIEGTAFEVASLKMSFVKVTNGGRYQGLYLDEDSDGCDIVSVSNNIDDAKTKVSDFKVCAETLVSLGERVVDKGAVETAFNASYENLAARK